MAITVDVARENLVKVVAENWANRARPLLGSQLKVHLLKRLPEFDEKSLGYKNFASFVRDCEGVSLRFRGTTDFAVVPAEYEKAFDEEAMPTEARIRIRPDFWQAFVGFAIPGQFRAYLRTTDRVIKGAKEDLPPDALPIVPVEKETQLSWRRSFIEVLGSDSPIAHLLTGLTTEGGFKAFTDGLAPHPELRRRWHGIFATHVAGVIRSWATPHGIPDETWLTSEQTVPISSDLARKRIYELFDTIPIEQLLELRLPVQWLLNVPPTGRKVDTDR